MYPALKPLAGCLLAVISVWTAGTARAESHKFAVIIGNNVGHDTARSLRFAEADARKMHRVLTQLGGFAPDNLHLLLGGTDQQAWEVLHRLEKAVDAVAVQPGARSLVMFYFSGHADGNLLELGDTSIRFEELLKFLKESGADVRLAVIDSCRSGKLVAMKGGRRAPDFDIRVQDEIESSGYAIITSSTQDELSQESVEIRGSFFTHFLVSALRGAGDRSADGKVTLSEAYDFAYQRTVARTSATVGGGQHPMYAFVLEGHGDIVITSPARARSHLVVAVQTRGRLVVLDEQRDTLVAEATVDEPGQVRFGVAPGPVRVYHVSPSSLRQARVTVPEAGETSIAPEDFQVVALTQAVSKGGLFIDTSASGAPLRIDAGVQMRRFPLGGTPVSFGAHLDYRPAASGQWQPLLRLAWTTAPDAGVSTGFHDLGLLAGIGRPFSFGPVNLRTEALIGYEQLLQQPLQGDSRYSGAFAYLGVLAIELPVGGGFAAAVSGGAGGRLLKLRDQGLVHRIDLQAGLALGWKPGE